MSATAFAAPAVKSPRPFLRSAMEWMLFGLLTVVLGGACVIAMVAFGCSFDFALGVALGRMSRGQQPAPTRANDGKDCERALRLGRKLRLLLGLDALARHRALRRQEAAERQSAVRMRLERRRHDKALRRAQIGRRMRYKLRQALLSLFAGIGVLAIVLVLVAALVR